MNWDHKKVGLGRIGLVKNVLQKWVSNNSYILLMGMGCIANIKKK